MSLRFIGKDRYSYLLQSLAILQNYDCRQIEAKFSYHKTVLFQTITVKFWGINRTFSRAGLTRGVSELFQGPIRGILKLIEVRLCFLCLLNLRVVLFKSDNLVKRCFNCESDLEVLIGKSNVE